MKKESQTKRHRAKAAKASKIAHPVKRKKHGASESHAADAQLNQSRERMNELLRLRSQMSQRRPSFVRHESWRYKRLHPRWRRPRGIDNKMRLRRKGWPKSVDIGYRGPRLVRGLHPLGKEDVLVYNEAELGKLNPELHVARFAASIGSRKRGAMLTYAKKLGIHVVNPTRIKRLAAT